MNVIRGTQKQYCPDQSHDGVWSPEQGIKGPPSRAFWPTGWKSFAAEVAAYNAPKTNPADLPDINLGGFDL